MEWPDKANFTAADNTPIYITAYSSQAATIQKSGQLSLYTIFRSGHMVSHAADFFFFVGVG